MTEKIFSWVFYEKSANKIVEKCILISPNDSADPAESCVILVSEQ